jgi:hypothetical protein
MDIPAYTIRLDLLPTGDVAWALESEPYGEAIADGKAFSWAAATYQAGTVLQNRGEVR